jgi:FKBP-type peptidyl-prolyl cis-trans isomerase
MKTKSIFFLLLALVALNGCTQDNWLDWKMQNELWLQENAKKEEIQTTHTGLQYKCIYAGINQSPHVDDAKIVKIKYSGRLINGFQFESSDGMEEYVTSFVPGFSEGLKLMKEFGIYEFYIPYALGYGKESVGTEGTSRHIPPYSTLIFKVELLDVY